MIMIVVYYRRFICNYNYIRITIKLYTQLLAQIVCNPFKYFASKKYTND